MDDILPHFEVSVWRTIDLVNDDEEITKSQKNKLLG